MGEMFSGSSGSWLMSSSWLGTCLRVRGVLLGGPKVLRELDARLAAKDEAVSDSEDDSLKSS